MYQTKIDAARALIEEHNNSLGDNGDKIDFDAFLDRLRKQGGISETTLGVVTYEDLNKCGLPLILAKAVAINIFRVEDKPTERIVIIDDDPEKLAKKLKPLDLVDHYDPEEPENPYGERLKKIVGNTRVLVFDANGKLLVDPTKAEVQRKRDDYPERTEVHVKDGHGLLKTFRVGDRPDREVDEHPVFTGVALNPHVPQPASR